METIVLKDIDEEDPSFIETEPELPEVGSVAPTVGEEKEAEVRGSSAGPEPSRQMSAASSSGLHISLAQSKQQTVPVITATNSVQSPHTGNNNMPDFSVIQNSLGQVIRLNDGTLAQVALAPIPQQQQPIVKIIETSVQPEDLNEAYVESQSTNSSSEKKQIKSAYFISGIICIFTPSILWLLWLVFLYCTSNAVLRREFSWGNLRLNIVLAVLYPLWVIQKSMGTAIRTLFGTDKEEYTNITKRIKLLEVIGEAIPQAVISIIYIVNNDGPEKNIINTVSFIFSVGSICIGVVTGVMALRDFYRSRTRN